MPAPARWTRLPISLLAGALLACHDAPPTRGRAESLPRASAEAPADARSADAPSDAAPADVPTGEAPADLVNPMIGTGGTGHTFPGATWPFGMVQLSPDTRLEGWEGCAGYYHDDGELHGFSHTHLSGTGVSDYGDVLLMPTVFTRASLTEPRGYSAPFRHEHERAAAGYYRVMLDAPGPAPTGGVDVELTTTARVGVHRYRFPTAPAKGPAGASADDVALEAGVLIDLEHRDELIASRLRAVGARELEGARRSRAWAQDQHVYFVARFSRPIASVTPLRADGSAHARALQPDDTRALLRFGPVEDNAAPLVALVGISAVDIDGARRNLEAETAARGFDFDGYREDARGAWNDALGKIAIRGGDLARRRVFYTALYHAMIAPNLYEDVDGRYRGTDLQVHESPGWTQHTVFSLWDTFRAAHPLYTIIEPARTGDFVQTMLAHYRDGGKLPMWELAGNYTGCMIGYHAVPVLADAYLKGLGGDDGEAMLTAMLDSAGRDHLGLRAYRERGHIPSEDEHESVSKTLEYAFDDACVAAVAARLGREDTARTFRARAQSWKNLLDPETGLMRPRVNGGWLEPFDPREVNNHYTEANAWQYSLFVPHDVPGLMARLGGREALARKLDELFASPPALSGRAQPDITGLIGQYAHGNEPSHHVAYLYNHAGQPWKAQARVREIVDTLYRDAPDGLPGNEDCGQMSAWYVLSALGFYPVDPCSGEYELGAPRFERATIDVGQGRAFTIEARGRVDEMPYVQRVTLNGAPLERPRIRHADVVAGGALVFELGREPNRAWGSQGVAPEGPVNDSGDSGDSGDFVVAPVVTPAPRSFTGALTVSLAHPDASAGAGEPVTIRYTLDGATPTRASSVYTAPLTITESCELRARAFVGEARASHETLARFHRRREDWSVRLTHRYNRQYSAGGDFGVIDGLRGTTNWRAGGWQGYQQSDFEAVVDLGAPTRVRALASGYLQDARSWIWLPKQVEYAVSDDGETFDVVGRATHDVPERGEDVLLRELGVTLARPRTTRYVRVRATNLGAIPDWHPGRGSRAFIFVDEIVIE